MKLKVIKSVRTNNFNDDLLLHKITKLWERASNDLANQVVTIYGVYHNYESDYKGDYSLSIAIEDNNSEPLLELPNHTKYEIFKVDKGEELGVINTWRKIWEREDAGILARAYSYDFEKYYPEGEIEIYIALK
ncbi:GyrI-like domain-containing protein [Robertmurraya sp.]|jgi:predicted transcriptional regulator YdeE|uniref:GyrI-like domain-containing protein n=1 Tax=Robertmurraya sp. TaxID=2837525 RepID=UPI003704D487